MRLSALFMCHFALVAATIPLHFEPGERAGTFLAIAGARTVSLSATEVIMEGSEMRLLGANRRARVTLEQPLQGRSHYLLGSDERRWRRGVAHYARLRVRGAWPGIDVVYYAHGRELEFDFVVAPGVDPRQIGLRLQGPAKLREPVIFQETPEGRRTIGGRAVRRGDRIGYEIESYDRTRALIIDPVIAYATAFGGGLADEATAIAVDAAGNVYIAGVTSSGNFPRVNPARPAVLGTNAFIAKLNPEGSELIYSTHFGNEGVEIARGIAVDSSGSAWVTGVSNSAVLGPYPGFQTRNSGGSDAFVTRLSPDGSAFLFATFLGGGRFDEGVGIAVDPSGSAYIAGVTESADFPTLNPLQAALGGGRDLFVAKIGSAGDLVYSTYFGGRSPETAGGIAVDQEGAVYVTGTTRLPGVPLLNPIREFSLGEEAFAAKLNPAGSALVFSTPLGGSAGDVANSIAVDSSGNAYVGGYTFSNDFPTVNAWQPSLASATAYKSTDGASSWVRSDSGLGGSTTALTVDPHDSSILYAVSERLLYKSTDGGATWNRLAAQEIHSVAVDPSTPAIIYAGGVRSVFKSTDGGSTFATVFNEIGIVKHLAVDPRAPSTVWAGSQSAADNDGLFKSEDSGATWQRIQGLSGRGLATRALAVDPQTSDVYVAAGPSGSSYKLTGGGASVTQIAGIDFCSFLLVDPVDSAVVFAVAGGRLYKSSDGGASFVRSGAFEDLSSVAVDPGNHLTVYLGSPASGVHKSTDGGETWEIAIAGLKNLSVSAIAVDPRNPSTVYAVSYVSSDGFLAKLKADGSGLEFSTYFGGEGLDYVHRLAVDETGAVYLAGSTDSPDFPIRNPFREGAFQRGDGFVARFDTSGKLEWSGSTGGPLPLALTANSSSAWIAGSASLPEFPGNRLQPYSPGTLFRTEDAGETWSAGLELGPLYDVATDSTGERVVVGGSAGILVSHDRGAMIQGRLRTHINTLVVDPLSSANMYACGVSGVWRSTDGGETWSIAMGGNCFSLAMDPTTPATLYASVGAGISKSTDAGVTWTRTSYRPSFAMSIAVDPRNPSVVFAVFNFAGTLDTGTHRSLDGGATWGRVSFFQVSRIMVHPASGAVFALGGPSGIFRSTDGGLTWAIVDTGFEPPLVNAMAADPVSPEVVYAAPSAGGLYRSADGGNRWQPVRSFGNGVVTGLAVALANPAVIHVATAINYAEAFVMKIAQ